MRFPNDAKERMSRGELFPGTSKTGAGICTCKISDKMEGGSEVVKSIFEGILLCCCCDTGA